MKKLKKVIESAMAGSKRRLNNLYDIQEAVRVYNDILENKEATTINGNIYNLCNECGLKVSVQGIGWKIKK